MVVGDDRAARDLAGDLRAWLAPRRVRYYPSRGVAYESHLAPPPHLVGLRVAALDALLGGERRRRAGRPRERPAGGRRQRRGALGEGARPAAAAALVHAAGGRAARPRRVRRGARRARATSASTRSRSAASSRCAAACSTSSRRPRSAPCASTCSTSRSSRCGGSRPSPSARSGEAEEVEIAPAAELAREHRELAEIAADGRRRRLRGGEEARPSGRTSPSCCRSSASARCSSWSARTPSWWWRPRRSSSRRSSDHWSDVCAAFDDEDAHHLYVEPGEHPRRRSARARGSGSRRSPPARRSSCARRPADTAARSLAEAEPELEKLVRSGYRTVVAFPRRGEGERAAYNLGRLKASWLARTAMAPTRRARCSSRRCASPRPRCARASSRRS